MARYQELQFTLSGFKSRSIQLRLQSGGQHRTTGFLTKCDNYAIHLPAHTLVELPPPGERGWAITHVHSGVLIWKVRQPREAMAIAHFLSQQETLPHHATRDELFAWHEAMGEEGTAPLAQQLQKIAPKWDNRYGFLDTPH